MTLFINNIKNLPQTIIITSFALLSACSQPIPKSTQETEKSTATQEPHTEIESVSHDTNDTEKTGTEHIVQMLDKNDDGESMVFEPAYIKVEVGDTVVFTDNTGNHSVISSLVPTGAKSFGGKARRVNVTLDKEGVYLYVCPPHEAMSMVGIIQVGNATNMGAVNEALPALKKRTYTNQDRWDRYVKQIQ